MKIQTIYKRIQDKKELWKYYNNEIKVPKILDTEDCYEFIINYISASEKTSTCLFKNIDKLKKDCPERLSHIVSTFFLGLWFYSQKTSFIQKSIYKELSELQCFQDNQSEIMQQFPYVWFMATLFHDLGYPEKDARELPIDEITIGEKEPIPFFYRRIYPSYYEYREQKEHGIWAGLQFDKDICQIREYKESISSTLSWRKELEELYHYVAWIILAHNIWLIRDNDTNLEKYQVNSLQDLILPSTKDESGNYEEYKFAFTEYPLFSFFCIIDTIDPIKSTSCLSDVDIKLESGDIIVKSNDVEYLNRINSINEWLLPTTKNGDTVTIHFHS